MICLEDPLAGGLDLRVRGHARPCGSGNGSLRGLGGQDEADNHGTSGLEGGPGRDARIRDGGRADRDP